MTDDNTQPDKQSLKEKLRSLKTELEDLEETVAFYFTHSSAHISGGEVARYEEELEELKRGIADIKRILGKVE